MITTYTITGMHCASCKELIEDVCRELPGVTSCAVDFATGSAHVTHDASFDGRSFKKAVAELGEYGIKEA
ncbi:MAG: heavy-metal-associated domain-containing protein [Candidatus Magasanikbacteria bacterium]|nr:heavy-metal-associated domain-containing protein [Candidatus Magasanikbacteria bacterium]